MNCLRMTTQAETMVYASKVPIERNSTSVSMSNRRAIMAVAEPESRRRSRVSISADESLTEHEDGMHRHLCLLIDRRQRAEDESVFSHCVDATRQSEHAPNL